MWLRKNTIGSTQPLTQRGLEGSAWRPNRDGVKACASTQPLTRTRGSTVRSRLKRTNAARAASGFTLIEILLVIVLIALLAGVVVPNISKIFRASVQSSVRRYAALVRYAYDHAVLTGKVHRIVLDLDDQSWSVEAASHGFLPPGQSSDDSRSSRDEDENKKKDEEEFQKVGGALVGGMPNGVEIVQVESWRLGKGKVATKGKVSVYAYPSGFVDEATVVLAENGQEKVQRFIITTRSLTGKVDVKTENGQ